MDRAANPHLADQIQRRLDQLTKPPGSLGRLEEIALQYGLIHGRSELEPPPKTLFVFCADHGISEEPVSAYPREVTAQMVRNFLSGGAAINSLCRHYGIDPLIIDMGVDADFGRQEGLVDRKIARGTRSFLRSPAMTRDQAERSVETGVRMAHSAAALAYGLAGVGEMGIGNTTSASAVLAALSGCNPIETVGPGTGLGPEQIQHKAEVISQAIEQRRPDAEDPLDVLTALGGFEIGGMTGFLLGAAAARLPVVVDGFIAGVAALLAVRLAPAAAGALFFGHASAEPGHRVLLELLGQKPLLKLEMRLGEGTGSALAMSLIEASIRLYREMATFASAQVSGPAESRTPSQTVRGSGA